MISRRPVSSPGRVEPLMGILRSKSNVGSISRSRSKGRSRASPLFVRRNKSAAAVTQEPSSPKVTCMGQVRVRENPTRRRCEWIRNASFYNKFAGKIKTSSFWSNWKLFTNSRRKSKNEKEKDSPRSQLDQSATEIEDEGKIFNIPKLFVSPPASTPPIIRSRSVPYSTSSLAYKFWEENIQREAESRNVKSENIDLSITELGFVRREILTRSKSEPARISEKVGVASG